MGPSIILLRVRRAEMNPVFGPVHSWRLGRALGVDMVASDRKYCSFDCVYCPGGKRARGVTGRPSSDLARSIAWPRLPASVGSPPPVNVT